MRSVFIMILVLNHWLTFSQSQTTIEGKVTDAKTNEPILFGTVALYQGGVLCVGTETDLDGAYFFNNVRPGTYDMEASLVGYAVQRIQGVVVKPGRTNKVNFQLSDDAVLLDEGCQIMCFRVLLIEINSNCGGQDVSAEKISNLPTKSINDIGISLQCNYVKEKTDIMSEPVYYIGGEHISPAVKIATIRKEPTLSEILEERAWNTFEDFDHLDIFPNPTCDIVYVKVQVKGFVEAAILSATGQTLIRNKVVNEDHVMFDVQNLVSGHYYAKVVYNDKVLTKSFIKMN